MEVKTIHKNPNFAAKLKKIAASYKNKVAAVGFPNSLHKKYENGASIINVAIWNNYGTDTIPARDFMTPANAEIKVKWKDMTKDAIKLINAGRLNPLTVLKAGAQEAEACIKASITELHEPPNAPATIRKKGDNNPLIDTGQMRDSVTSVIRENN